jgi:subtilisin
LDYRATRSWSEIEAIREAGNSAWDFDYAPNPDVPAAYPQVLTVTAMTDSDGRSGGSGGPPACSVTQGDDKYASFSNYAATSGGSAHTIAAPGVCIRSTWMGGSHSTISGTSMATPHVAGTVALCLSEGGSSGPCDGLQPAGIIDRIRSDAEGNAAGNGFTGDPLSPVSGGGRLCVRGSGAGGGQKTGVVDSAPDDTSPGGTTATSASV